MQFLKGLSYHFRCLILAILLLCPCFSVFAQQKHFFIPIEFVVENGTTDQTVVKVMKEGQVVYSYPGKTNMRLKLDFNKNYQISFSKEKYITKSIVVNTSIPAERILQPVEPYKIGVKLFKQYEGINIVVYNQPVARIHFNTLLDEFDYDTDYTKSILSKLTETEHQLEKMAAEERLTSSGTTADGSMERIVKQNNSLSSSGSLQERNLMQSTTGADKLDQSVIQEPFISNTKQISKTSSDITESNNINPAGNAEENRSPAFQKDNEAQTLQGDQGIIAATSEKNSPAIDRETAGLKQRNTGTDVNLVNLIPSRYYDTGNNMDVNTGSDIYSEALRIADNTTSYRTQWKEQGRTITVIKIVNGLTVIEYRKVDCDWGGLFYFKDQYFAISQSVYNWATGEK